MACSMDVPRIAEPALSCLHKLVQHSYLSSTSVHMSVHCAQMELYIGAICSRECAAVVSLKGCRRSWLERVFVHAQVAHAYLHAESTPAGRLDDGSIVAQVAARALNTLCHAVH